MRKLVVLFFAVFALALVSNNIYAQAGDKTVEGTIQSISETSIVIKTADQTEVAIGISDFASYSINNASASLNQFSQGMQVKAAYYDYPEGKKLAILSGETQQQ